MYHREGRARLCCSDAGWIQGNHKVEVRDRVEEHLPKNLKHTQTIRALHCRVWIINRFTGSIPGSRDGVIEQDTYLLLGVGALCDSLTINVRL